MDQDRIIQAIIKRAEIGAVVSPEQALREVADLIDRLDKVSDGYEKEVATLVDIGACLWQLVHGHSDN